MTFANVVRLTVYATDVDELFKHWAGLQRRFGNPDSGFTTSVVGVTRLAAPQLMVLLEATAVDLTQLRLPRATPDDLGSGRNGIGRSVRRGRTRISSQMERLERTSVALSRAITAKPVSREIIGSVAVIAKHRFPCLPLCSRSRLRCGRGASHGCVYRAGLASWASSVP